MSCHCCGIGNHQPGEASLSTLNPDALSKFRYEASAAYTRYHPSCERRAVRLLAKLHRAVLRDGTCRGPSVSSSTLPAALAGTMASRILAGSVAWKFFSATLPLLWYQTPLSTHRIASLVEKKIGAGIPHLKIVFAISADEQPFNIAKFLPKIAECDANNTFDIKEPTQWLHRPWRTLTGPCSL